MPYPPFYSHLLCCITISINFLRSTILLPLHPSILNYQPKIMSQYPLNIRQSSIYVPTFVPHVLSIHRDGSTSTPLMPILKLKIINIYIYIYVSIVLSFPSYPNHIISFIHAIIPHACPSISPIHIQLYSHIVGCIRLYITISSLDSTI